MDFMFFRGKSLYPNCAKELELKDKISCSKSLKFDLGDVRCKLRKLSMAQIGPYI
jgi:hypothetical protein